MSWIYLLIAGIFECAWAIALKYSNGFTKLYPSVFTVITMLISLGGLALALKTIPVGTAYAVWTGIGVIGVAIWGIFALGEPANILRVTCLLLIFSGIIGLKITSY